MKYEKTICPTCLHGTSNIEMLLAEAARVTGAEFYDFGAGRVVAPSPVVTVGKWSHIVGIENPTNRALTIVEFSFDDFNFDVFVVDIKLAMDMNRIQTEPYKKVRE